MTRGGPPQHVATILAIARRNAGMDEVPHLAGAAAPPDDEPRPNSPEDVGYLQRPANQEGERHAPGAGKAGAPPEPAGESPSSPAAAPSPFAPHTPADVAHPVPAHPPKICRSCGAEIMWTKSETTGRSMPVDFAPSEKGNVALWDRRGSIVSRVLTGQDLAEARAAGRPLRMPHHATCPQGKDWKRKR